MHIILPLPTIYQYQLYDQSVLLILKGSFKPEVTCLLVSNLKLIVYFHWKLYTLPTVEYSRFDNWPWNCLLPKQTYFCDLHFDSIFYTYEKKLYLYIFYIFLYFTQYSEYFYYHLHIYSVLLTLLSTLYIGKSFLNLFTNLWFF